MQIGTGGKSDGGFERRADDFFVAGVVESFEHLAAHGDEAFPIGGLFALGGSDAAAEIFRLAGRDPCERWAVRQWRVWCAARLLRR